MKIVINQVTSNFIEVKLEEYSSNLDLPKWSNILYQVLHDALGDRSLYLMTLSPQLYSLGFELDNPVKMKVGNNTIIYNLIQKCTNELLHKIIESEEFERGLLRIVILESQKVEDVLANVFFQFVTNDDIRKSRVNFELITCEGDGKILCWFNPTLPMDEVRSKLNTIIQNA